jgi:beta-glucanase (GH16 family)
MNAHSVSSCLGLLAGGLALSCSSAIAPPPPSPAECVGSVSCASAGSFGANVGGASSAVAGSGGTSGAVAQGGTSGAVSLGFSGSPGTLGVGGTASVTGPDMSNGSTGPASGGAAGAAATSWTLVWSDEFNGSNGSPVDSTKWTHETGGDGHGNQELEYYTEDVANSQQMDGNLVITATSEGAAQYSCWNGTCQYTSARLVTNGHYTTKYGRIEARLKVPTGKGVWPAFWMLGDNISVVNWPTCGELDIMETIGSDSATLHGSMHGPGYSGANPLTASTTLPSGAKLSDDFHIYSIEWGPDVVRFYLDSVLYETRTPADMPEGGVWVYDRPFFIILNVAVGGQWPGSPDASTAFPVKMLVDYVHVYNATPAND